MTDTGNAADSQIELRCGLFVETPSGLAPARVARASDQIVLIVRLVVRGGAGRPVDLAIELYRGDELRHRVTRQVSLDAQSPWIGGFHLHRGRGPGRSARLSCRVFLDGRLSARRQVLLDDHAIDAQGRFDAAQDRPASPATQVEFHRALNSLLEDGELSDRSNR